MTTSRIWSNDDGNAGWDAVRAMSQHQRAKVFQRWDYLCKRLPRVLPDGKKSHLSKLTPAEAAEMQRLRPIVARLRHIINEVPPPNKPVQNTEQYRTIQLPASDKNLSW